MALFNLKGFPYYLRTCKQVFAQYSTKTAPIVSLIKKIRRERKLLLSLDEAYNIAMCVIRTGKIAGDIAEVGVYQGASAKLIAEFKKEKQLQLFDSFEGLPKLQELDKTNFYEGQFAASYSRVKEYLAPYRGINLHKGFFPETGAFVKDKIFSFVHLDVDIYESTRACLDFFYPRLNHGAVLLSHDYINSPGVKRAFDEFFADKPEPILELYRPRRTVQRSGSQCLIVKI